MSGFVPKLNVAGDAWTSNDWEDQTSRAQKVSTYSGNVANAAAVAALPAVAAKTNYITKADFFSGGATSASIVLATVAGLLGGTRSFPVAVPAGVLVGGMVTLTFDPPLPASAVNTAITVTLPALGAGNTNASATVSGLLI